MPGCFGEEFFLKYHKIFTIASLILWSGPQRIICQAFSGLYLWLRLLSEAELHHLWGRGGRRKEFSCVKFWAQERGSIFSLHLGPNTAHRDWHCHLSPSGMPLLKEAFPSTTSHSWLEWRAQSSVLPPSSYWPPKSSMSPTLETMHVSACTVEGNFQMWLRILH